VLPGEGAAALIVCRAERAGRLDAKPVFLRSVGVRTRTSGSFEVYSPSIGVDLPPSPTVEAARTAMEMAGIGPEDLDVVQVQDTEAGAELIHLAECGLCEDGAQVELYAGGCTGLAGRIPVNTDGAASPTASRSEHPASARFTRSCFNYGAAPESDRFPALRVSASRTSTERPA